MPEIIQEGENMREIPLSHMKRGQRGRVVRLRHRGRLKRRMLDMGIVPGVEIEMIRKAPFGDPLEYRLRGYHISIRKREGDGIIVQR